jgi:hypothetical protein
MGEHISVILPTATAALLDRAIRDYIGTLSPPGLRNRLKQEGLANAERDLRMAAE